MFNFFGRLFKKEFKFPFEEFKGIILKHKAQEWFLFAFKSFKGRRHVYLPCTWVLKNVDKDAKVLETGAGAGVNLLWLAEHGFMHLYGFDIDDPAVNAARDVFSKSGHDVKYWQDDGIKPSRIEGYGVQFDVILALNWLYHVPDLKLEGFLDEYKKYLSPGGTIIFDTIDIKYNAVPLNLFCTTDLDKPMGHRRETEYKTRYSQDEVKGIAKAKGFKVIKTSPIRDTMVPRNVYIFKAFLLAVLILGVWSLPASAAIVKTHKNARGWELLVDGKPFFIHGMCYIPDTIGETSYKNTRRNWEIVDDDHDGRNDFAYQTWVDANRNNQRDPDENEIGDFELMHQMGVNAIRVYHHVSDDPALQELNRSSSKILNYPAAAEKKILRELYSKYGIMTAMGDFLGAYTVATGASWEAGTDYTDPVQRTNMLKSVEAMVLDFKDEPYILMWILGNENNLSFAHTQASRQPEAYARFVNEAANLIKKIDKRRHPVALSNGGDRMLEYYAKHTKAIDIFGTNLYGENGFHELWKKVAKLWDRPVMLTEFGTLSPIVHNGVLNEKYQAQVHRRSWEDIFKHRAGHEAPGNAIGGFVFEWTDNWWENEDEWHQNINPNGTGWNNEYNGVCSLGNGKAGFLMRQLKKDYMMYRDLWKTE